MPTTGRVHVGEPKCRRNQSRTLKIAFQSLSTAAAAKCRVPAGPRGPRRHSPHPGFGGAKPEEAQLTCLSRGDKSPGLSTGREIIFDQTTTGPADLHCSLTLLQFLRIALSILFSLVFKAISPLAPCCLSKALQLRSQLPGQQQQYGRISCPLRLGRGGSKLDRDRPVSLRHFWLYKSGRLDLSPCMLLCPMSQPPGSLLTICRQLPQLIANYKAQNADALSMGFLIIWLLGDITNLAGVSPIYNPALPPSLPNSG